MRVLLVSDLHYDLARFDWLVQRVADPVDAIDVAVIAGDLLDVASSVPLDTQIAVILAYLERLAAVLPTVVCSGNHDLDHRTESGREGDRLVGRGAAPRRRTSTVTRSTSARGG